MLKDCWENKLLFKVCCGTDKILEEWKIQPNFLTDEDFWHAYWLGTHNIVHTSIESGTLLHCSPRAYHSFSGCLLHYFLSGGKGTKLFVEMDLNNLLPSLAYLLLVWLLIDAGAYYVHKWLHIPWVYRNIHKWYALHLFVKLTWQ